jgi:hypothetical protein
VNTPTYGVSSFLAKILSPVVGNTENTVKNSCHFAEFVRGKTLKADQVLDFPKSAVRGSWKRRTFVTRKRAKFTVHFCSGDVSECSLLFCTNDAI